MTTWFTFTTFLSGLPSKLGRVTSGGRFISVIDGLRFLAILPVIFQHASERMLRAAPAGLQHLEETQSAFLVSRGTIGVFLFFAISGFILCLPFAKMHLGEGKRVALKKYFKRRLTRLEPPYIIWMTVFAIVLLVKGGYALSELGPHYFASLGYVHNLFFSSYTPINPVAWSLEIEIQFYLLAPFLAAAFFAIKHRPTRQVVTTLALVAFVSVQHYFDWVHPPYKLSILGQLQYFWVGFIMADEFLNRFRQTVNPRVIWDVLGIAGFVLMMYTWSQEYGKSLLFLLGLWVVFQSAFRGKYVTAFLANPWITAIGGMCYTIYLIHLPILEAQIALTGSWIVFDSFWANFGLQLLVALPLIFIFSSVFFLLIEKPCMNPNWPRDLKLWLKGKFSRKQLCTPPPRGEPLSTTIHD